MKFHIILSVTDDNVIGIKDEKKYTLPCFSSEDIAFFKGKTVGNGKNAVVMGYNTWVSLSEKPLANRLNVVLSKKHGDGTVHNNAVLFISSLEEIFTNIPSNIENVYIIGGGKVYKTFIENHPYMIDKVYLTRFKTNLDNIKYEKIMVDIDLYLSQFCLEERICLKKMSVKLYLNEDINCDVWFETYTLKENYEIQYLKLLNKALFLPVRNSRNGEVFSSFGERMIFPMRDDEIPILTTKRIAWKTCIKELLFFLKGQTDNAILQEQKVHIWDGNTSREFLDSHELEHFETGDLGKMYGFQWRHWGAEYKGKKENYENQGIDQLETCANLIIKDPHSRRIIVSAWNVSDIPEMCLNPCHILYQFYVDSSNKLWLQMYQRSADMFLGVPFNILSYAVLLRLMCIKTELKIGGLVHILGDWHVYKTHLEACVSQLKNSPSEKIPILKINPKKKFEEYTMEDFSLENYENSGSIRAEMSA
jgi:dihydrofolate reductase/thymidylate synthase